MRQLLKSISLLFIILLSPLTLFSLTLDLKSAIEIGLKNNKELKIAREKVKAAKADLAIARSSFFPSIEAKGNYTYLGIVPEAEMMSMGYVPMPTMTDPYRHTHTLETIKMKMARQNNYEASISVTQPIFMWGRLINSYKVSKIKLEIEQENYKKTKLKIIKEIKNSFYGYLVAKESFKLMEESYKQLEENVKSAEVNYKSGIITKYDFMAISIQLANLEPAVLQVKNGVLLAKEKLKNVLGLDTDDFNVEGDFKYNKVEYDFEKLKKIFFKNNLDLKILTLQKKVMAKVISLSRAANKPSIVGVFNYKYSYIPDDDDTFGSSEPDSWTATVALTVPISEWFPWSKTMNDIDKSKENYKQIDLTYKQVAEGLLIRLKQIYLELETQYNVIESQKKNIKNANETYLFRKKQYKSGLIRYTELIDAQVSLTKAKTNYLEAVFKYIMAKANLDEILGKENRKEF